MAEGPGDRREKETPGFSKAAVQSEHGKPEPHLHPQAGCRGRRSRDKAQALSQGQEPGCPELERGACSQPAPMAGAASLLRPPGPPPLQGLGAGRVAPHALLLPLGGEVCLLAPRELSRKRACI